MDDIRPFQHSSQYHEKTSNVSIRWIDRISLFHILIFIIIIIFALFHFTSSFEELFHYIFSQNIDLHPITVDHVKQNVALPTEFNYSHCQAQIGESYPIYPDIFSEREEIQFLYSQYTSNHSRLLLGFFHVWCKPVEKGDLITWKDIVFDLVHEANSSGLLPRITRWYFGLLDNTPDDVIWLKELLGSKLFIIFENPSPESWEIPTISYIKLLSCQLRSVPILGSIFYTHSKGIRYAKNPPLLHTVLDWRNLISYYTIGDGHSFCLKALETYDTCGTNVHGDIYSESIPLHYSGNYWWGNIEYLGEIPPYNKRVVLGSRFVAEFWILSHCGYFFCTRESDTDHYVNPYPKDRYVGKGVGSCHPYQQCSLSRKVINMALSTSS